MIVSASRPTAQQGMPLSPRKLARNLLPLGTLYCPRELSPLATSVPPAVIARLWYPPAPMAIDSSPSAARDGPKELPQATTEPG